MNENVEFEKDMNTNKKTTLIVVCVLLLLLVGTGVYRYLKNKTEKHSETSEVSGQNSGQTSQNVDQTSNSNDNFDYKGDSPATAPTDTPVDSSDPYSLYSAGVNELNQKHYQSSIDYFDKALALRTDDANFYIKKSEAEVGLNKKQNAVNTINKGLAVLPNNELLLNQMDILNNVVK